MIPWRLGSTLAIAMWLAGCAAQPTRPLVPVDVAAADRAQARRSEVLSSHPQWSLRGRIALSNGRDGGTGRIDWQQDAVRYAMAVSAPVTRQSWRLSGDPGSARLEGLEGGPREGDDAQALLREATGWVIPVAALGAWVRGTPAAGLPPGVLLYGSDGRLSRLQQSGWTIDYDDWRLQPALGVELPYRVTAAQGNARMKLVIDAWQADAPPS